MVAGASGGERVMDFRFAKVPKGSLGALGWLRPGVLEAALGGWRGLLGFFEIRQPLHTKSWFVEALWERPGCLGGKGAAGAAVERGAEPARRSEHQRSRHTCGDEGDP